MKKITLQFLVLAFTFMSTSLSAQEAATTKGDFLVDFGVGFIGGGYDGYKSVSWSSPSLNKVELPTISVSVQKAFWDDITIGGMVAFNIMGSEYDYSENNGYYRHSRFTQTNIYILGRGEYHFNRLIKLDSKYDLYAGALAGSRISTSNETQIYEGDTNWRIDYPNRTSTSVGPDGGIFGGFRLYFTKNMSVYGEAGFGITALRAGLCWRL